MKKQIYMSIIIGTLLLSIQTCFALETWTNWAGNYTCSPKKIIYPKELSELCTTVKDIAEQGNTIRIAGKGYSRSDLVCTDDYIISLKYLNRPLSINMETQRVTVESGISLFDLNTLLEKYGLAIANQAAASEVSLAGALCTGSHGTGYTGTLSSFIYEMELVMADGTLRRLSKESDPEAFAAAKISLGALGIIYSVTLQCEPLFKVYEKIIKTHFSDIIKNFKKLFDDNDYFQFIWTVETDIVSATSWNRVPLQEVEENSTAEACHIALAWFHTNDNEKDLASEIAVPIAKLPEALQIIKQISRKYKTSDIPTNIVVRFAKADQDILLSQCADHDVAYINVWAPVDTSYLPMYQEVEEALYQLHGRPHWGKINFINYEKALHLYGQNFERFLQVKESFDPKGVFSNNYIKQLLKTSA